MIGSIVLSGLTNGFVSSIEDNSTLDEGLRTAIVASASSGVDFSTVSDVEQRLRGAGLDTESTAVVVDSYSDAQLRALRAGLLGGAALALLALLVTKNLPSTVPEDDGMDPSATARDTGAGPPS